MLGITADDRSGTVSRFFGELLEFSRLAPEVRDFAPELGFQLHNFGTRLLEGLFSLTGIAERGLELCCELSSLRAKGRQLFAQLSTGALGLRGQPSVELASLGLAL
jgi:hypothetical protein